MVLSNHFILFLTEEIKFRWDIANPYFAALLAQLYFQLILSALKILLVSFFNKKKSLYL